MGTCDGMTEWWLNDWKLVMNQKIPSDIRVLHVLYHRMNTIDQTRHSCRQT